MTAHTQIAQLRSSVKETLLNLFDNGVDDLIDRKSKSGRALEDGVWTLLLEVGRKLLEGLLTLACLHVVADIVGHDAKRWRKDKDYTVPQTTTLGEVRVPVFAFREDGRTHAPAKDLVFPMYPHCRSSELCLEWETRLGCTLPFREAQDALTYFTHGAVKLEDTTIARHAYGIGSVLERNWTYRTAEQIAEILEKRATRDRNNNKPIVYGSTDAHALRHYVDNSWNAPWKMFNGIRIWCVDRVTEQVIHLGGEYTWGDCRDVATRIGTLMKDLMPKGTHAPQVVFIADGMPWIREHVHPTLPEGTQFILDFYHVMEHLAEYAAKAYGKGTRRATAWLASVKKRLLGKRNYERKRQTERRGHTKSKRKRRRQRTVHVDPHTWGAGESMLRALIRNEPASAALNALSRYLAENCSRMNYPSYRQRGLNIGSGAMESLHRIASQVRLKRSGSRWLPESAEAITNLRLMLLAGRWKAFWSHADLSSTLCLAFAPPPVSEA